MIFRFWWWMIALKAASTVLISCWIRTRMPTLRCMQIVSRRRSFCLGPSLFCCGVNFFDGTNGFEAFLQLDETCSSLWEAAIQIGLRDTCLLVLEGFSCQVWPSRSWQEEAIQTS